MEQFIQNILIGVRQWVNGKLEDLSFVISSHINSLTERMTTAETKLEGIETGAEVNVIEAITVNGTAVPVSEKTAAITITPGSSITVDSNDKVLALSNEDVLSATLSLVHDDTNHFIKLIGKNSEVISSFSTDDFIKDGMLDYAGLHVRTTESSVTTWTPALPSGVTEPVGTTDGSYLVLVWNTGASKTPTFIDITTLVNEYTAGTGLTLSGHQFSLNVAGTNSEIGGVKAGDNVTIANDGTLTVSYATASIAGAVKVGTGLTIDASTGVLSATGTQASYADTTTYGIVKIGDHINVTDGVISMGYTSYSTYGVVRVGSGLSVADGVISVLAPTKDEVLAVLNAEEEE